MQVRPPLAVDLDGTLVRCDTLFESIRSLLRQAPRKLVAAALRLPAGRASVKRAVARAFQLDAPSLPYNEPLLAYIRAEHVSGRRVGLFTAADQSIADAVAAHVVCFDIVLGSDGVANLRGSAKASAIEAAFGPVFAYAGDSLVDVPIFNRAAAVILAGPRVSRLAKMVPEGKIEARFPTASASRSPWA
jgi:hypothetical protein